MAENSWAERRGRMVKCKSHGLHYDPKMTTGCTLCLRAAAKAQPARPPQLVVILLCVLGMTGILFYLFGPGREEATDFVDLGVAANPVAGAPKLDPGPFRPSVEALETALFRTPLEETGDLLVVSGDVRAAASGLSAAILRAEPVNGVTAADLIARLAQSIPADQVIMADIEQAQSQWTRIRQQRFSPADWFSQPAAAGAGSAASAAGYSSVAASLRALIEDAVTEVEALDEPASATPAEDDPALRWRTFTRDFQAELDGLESRLPDRPPAGAASRLLVAIQDLERAMSLARALAKAAQPPLPTDPRFDDAINAALRAQQGFDDLAI